MPEIIPIDNFSKEENELSFKFLRLDSEAKYGTREPHRHNYYEIFHFTSGGGVHAIDFEYHEIKDHSFHFVAPGQVHMLRRDPGARGYALIFSRPFFHMHSSGNNVLSDYPAFNKTSSPVLSVNPSLSADFIKLSGDIEKEYESSHPFRTQILFNYTNIFLLKCKSAFQADSSFSKVDSASLVLVKKFLTFIEDKFSTHHRVSDYADLLSITPNHLNDVSKQITGKTALDLIQERILLEAKRLLLHSDFNSKQIAFELNFSDPSYFSRFFKLHTGMSPDSFRKVTREKYH